MSAPHRAVVASPTTPYEGKICRSTRSQRPDVCLVPLNTSEGSAWSTRPLSDALPAQSTAPVQKGATLGDSASARTPTGRAPTSDRPPPLPFEPRGTSLGLHTARRH